jgi:hypothetical protein
MLMKEEHNSEVTARGKDSLFSSDLQNSIAGCTRFADHGF